MTPQLLPEVLGVPVAVVLVHIKLEMLEQPIAAAVVVVVQVI